MCEEWLCDRKEFYDWACNNGYKNELTIDRKDNNEGYYPWNCRWVDKKTQSNNTRRNVNITYNGSTKTLSEWSEELGIKRCVISTRLKRGWTIEKAFGNKKEVVV